MILPLPDPRLGSAVTRRAEPLLSDVVELHADGRPAVATNGSLLPCCDCFFLVRFGALGRTRLIGCGVHGADLRTDNPRRF